MPRCRELSELMSRCSCSLSITEWVERGCWRPASIWTPFSSRALTPGLYWLEAWEVIHHKITNFALIVLLLRCRGSERGHIGGLSVQSGHQCPTDPQNGNQHQSVGRCGRLCPQPTQPEQDGHRPNVCCHCKLTSYDGWLLKDTQYPYSDNHDNCYDNSSMLFRNFNMSIWVGVRYHNMGLKQGLKFSRR